MSVLPWRPWRDRPIVLPGAGTGKRPCTEMPLAEHNNMVKTIPSDRTMNIAATAASPPPLSDNRQGHAPKAAE